MGWFSKDKPAASASTEIKPKDPIGKAVTPSLSEDELRKLDAIMLIDNSGSMGAPSDRMPGRTRLGEVEEVAMVVAREAEKYDDDGLTLIAFGSDSKMFDGVTADKVHEAFTHFGQMGTTNLTAALDDGIAKTRSSDKEVVIIAYTDGRPNDPGSVIKAIKGAAKEFGRPRIGLTIIQVGTDRGATDFLNKLDNEMDGVPDVVACVTAAEAEGLSYGQLCWLARNA